MVDAKFPSAFFRRSQAASAHPRVEGRSRGLKSSQEREEQRGVGGGSRGRSLEANEVKLGTGQKLAQLYR